MNFVQKYSAQRSSCTLQDSDLYYFPGTDYQKYVTSENIWHLYGKPDFKNKKALLFKINGFSCLVKQPSILKYSTVESRFIYNPFF